MVATRDYMTKVDFALGRVPESERDLSPGEWAELVNKLIKDVPLSYLRGFKLLKELISNEGSSMSLRVDKQFKLLNERRRHILLAEEMLQEEQERHRATRPFQRDYLFLSRKRGVTRIQTFWGPTEGVDDSGFRLLNAQYVPSRTALPHNHSLFKEWFEQFPDTGPPILHRLRGHLLDSHDIMQQQELHTLRALHTLEDCLKRLHHSI